MPTDRLAAIETFVRVVEARSFSAAARMIGTSQPTVSKIVAELERRLGTRLLNRTTRHLSLTEAGATYYERCRSVMAEIEDAEHEVSAGSGQPSRQPPGEHLRGVGHRLGPAGSAGFPGRPPGLSIES